MTPATHDAVVIIPHYNDTARLRTCLTALMASPSAALARCDVVVCDNGSTQDLGPLRAEFATVRFVDQPEKGAAAARNMAVAHSTAPRLFFLDADCVPAPDWLETALALDGFADLTGGHVGTFDETPAPRSGAEAFETVFAFNQRDYIERKGFSVTANLLTTRAIFDDVGPFVVGTSEDLDWCHRARAKGYRIAYAPQLRVGHPTRQDWAALRHKWRRITAESWQTEAQARQGLGLRLRLRWLARAGGVLASVAVHAPQVIRHPALENRAERLAGLITLARLRGLRAVWMLRQVLDLPV